MTERTLHCDTVVIGGGIAGLWLLERLRSAGHDAILLERDALGGAQTLASQGIIHGGLKYALSGILTPASSAIADMPARWRACLAGRGDIDLRRCRVLSQHYWMWSGGDMRSRFKTFLGSRSLRGRVERMSPDDYPDVLRDPLACGGVYRLSDFVIDTPSLLRALAEPNRAHIGQAADLALQPDADGSVQALQARGSDGATVTVRAYHYVLAAGQGNESLLQQLGREEPAMQRRPLHMVTVHADRPAWLHVIGDDFGMTPRLTVTSHPLPDGDWLWYLGGELAESGVQRGAEEQIDTARRTLERLFPAVRTRAGTWNTLRVDRAEPARPDRQRPDDAFLQKQGNTVTVWPTKLALAPNLGDAVLSRLTSGIPLSGEERREEQERRTVAVHELFPPAPLAPPPWEQAR